MMKKRLQDKFERAVAELGSAKQFLVNDSTEDFSKAIDKCLEDLSRVQDDLSIYDEIVRLKTENDNLRTENDALRLKADSLSEQSE